MTTSFKGYTVGERVEYRLGSWRPWVSGTLVDVDSSGNDDVPFNVNGSWVSLENIRHPPVLETPVKYEYRLTSASGYVNKWHTVTDGGRNGVDGVRVEFRIEPSFTPGYFREKYQSQGQVYWMTTAPDPDEFERVNVTLAE